MDINTSAFIQVWMTEFSILPELHLYESLSSSLGTKVFCHTDWL